MAMITDKERQEILETLWTVEGDLLRPPTGDSLERRLERLRRVIPLAERALQSPESGWEQAISASTPPGSAKVDQHPRPEAKRP